MRIPFLLAAALAAATPAIAQVLTLDEARQRALQDQPALRALELGARAREETAVADGALPDPRLKLGALNFPTRNFPSAREDMTQVGVSWEQAFPGGEKRRLRTERTLAEAEQERAEAAGVRQGISRDVGFAWLDAWLAAANERLVGELADEHRRSIELARIAVSSGKGSQADVLAARQMLNQTVDRRLELAAAARRARAALARWVPDAAARPLPEDLPGIAAPAPLATLRPAIEMHPQHAMHLRAEKVAEAEVALAREASKPDRSVELGYYSRYGGRSDMVMLQVAIELPLFADRKQDRLLAAKRAQADRARAQRLDHLRELHSELESMYADWEIAGERLTNVTTSIVPDAKARLDALVAQHSAGSATLAAVFEARRNVVDARIQQLALQAARFRARIGLQYFEHEEGHR